MHCELAGDLRLLVSDGGETIITVKLENVVKVDRTRDRNDWHDWCLDIDIEQVSLPYQCSMRSEMRTVVVDRGCC